MNVKAADQEYIANTYSRFDLQIVSGHGSLVYDDAGKEYIDLGSGIAANAFGVCDAYWQQAVIEQVMRVQPPICITPSRRRAWRSCCAKRPV